MAVTPEIEAVEDRPKNAGEVDPISRRKHAQDQSRCSDNNDVGGGSSMGCGVQCQTLVLQRFSKLVYVLIQSKRIDHYKRVRWWTSLPAYRFQVVLL
ncbi:MAG: hypothetical protein DMG32_11450 [Acidobacteria bacterium]|nr:MAG: hypothetical protein DMG32_11450 [Acidobacteriota bacterium]